MASEATKTRELHQENWVLACFGHIQIGSESAKVKGVGAEMGTPRLVS